MVAIIILFVLLIILTNIYVYCFFKDGKDEKLKTFFIKLACSLSFLSIGIISFCINDSKSLSQILILIGLALCLIGDIVLGLRRITPFHDLCLLIGSLVFILGHFGYDSGLFLNFHEDVLALIIITIVIWIIYLILMKLTHVNLGTFKIPCLFYSLSSSIMFSITLVSLIKYQTIFHVIIFVGITLFTISDILLCYTYFHDKYKDSFTFKLISSYAYFIGQGIIALSIMFF